MRRSSRVSQGFAGDVTLSVFHEELSVQSMQRAGAPWDAAGGCASPHGGAMWWRRRPAIAEGCRRADPTPAWISWPGSPSLRTKPPPLNPQPLHAKQPVS